MPHDFHFLERTVDIDRALSLPALERAMLLYNDPQLLRHIFEQARLPESLEDIAIGLVAGEKPPHLIVHRSGHFRTILGAGMVVRRAHLVTRPQFDGMIERMTELRARLTVAEKLTGERGGAGQLVLRLMKAGNYLSREEFVGISCWQPLLRNELVRIFLHSARDLVLLRGSLRRYSAKLLANRAEELLHQYWERYFFLGHVAQLAVMDRHHHAQPINIATEKLYSAIPSRLFRLCQTGAAVRGAWVSGQLGRDILRSVKDLYGTEDDRWEVVEAATALFAIAARNPSTRAEIRKVLDLPIRKIAPADRPAVESLVATFRTQYATIDERSPDNDQHWSAEVAQVLVALQRPQHDAPDPNRKLVIGLPAEFDAAIAAHSLLPLRKHANLLFLLRAAPRVATAEPQQLYFPEHILSLLRQSWCPSDSQSLLDAQETLIEKPTPIKVEKAPGRNEVCPCGSGKKYKRCCDNR